MGKTYTQIGLAILLASFSQQAVSDVDPGFSAKLSATAYYNNSPESSLNGGLGRYSTGDSYTLFEEEGDANAAGVAQIDLGYKGRFWSRFEFSAHLQARDSNYSDQRDEYGLIEAKLKYLQPLTDDQRFLFTVGQFFLPTSMENTDSFWDSPYTISWSSLNSWIGEEFRSIGLDWDYRIKFDGGSKLTFAATAFHGNDANSTLLSWRGFSYGNNVLYYDETVPLPGLTSLNDGGLYAAQNPDGTTPYANDLDGKWGYALRSAIEFDNGLVFKLTGIDNQGDTELYRSEYAWHTKFAIAGFTYPINSNWTLLGEYSQGSTTMGPDVVAVDVDFKTAYLLTSYLKNNWRYSLRLYAFEVEDQNPSRNIPVIQDINDDEGQSATFAIFWEPVGKPWSIGGEILGLDSTRERW